MFSPWIAQHFLNPAYFWPGVALVTLPIIVHLINRLRFRRVRFAAMEFLLRSDQKNRRRILLEQLLLLLLRVLIVAAIVALIARLILDPQQLSLFQGAQAHHVVLLDDSGSMRDRVGDGTAFDRAKEVVQKLVSDGARRPGANKFTLLLLSRPDSTYANLGERAVDEPFVQELTSRLEGLECTFGRGDLLTGLEAAGSRLAGDRDSATYLHVLSDFRRADWIGSSATAAVLQSLDETGVNINFVKTVGDSHENVAVADLTGAVEVAAAGIPVELTARVQNFGSREAVDVRLSVTADRQALPLNLVFPAIPAGESVERRFEVEFDSPGRHQVAVALGSDALESDNVRFLALDIPTENNILIVDGTPGGEEGLYIADALAADRSVTGFAPVVMDVDGLRRTNVDQYQSVYLVNLAELPPDALKTIDSFVDSGGGLVWFLGDGVRPAFYNERLYAGANGLFPVPLRMVPQTLEHSPGASGPDLLVESHPLFRILSGQDNPFLDLVRINRYFGVDTEQQESAEIDIEGLQVLARLRTREPLIYEHRHGEGKVVTFLTSAGPLPAPEGGVWNNWASGPAAPSYAVLHLELQRQIARGDRAQPRRIVGEPIVEELLRSQYQEDVEILLPNEELVSLKASAPPADEDPGDEASQDEPWKAVFRETDRPGVYVVRRFDNSGQPDDESDLKIVEEEELRQQIGPGVSVIIQEAETLDWIRSESPGHDVRWWLLAGLLLLFIGEHALAYRVGYHTT
jgi:Aerotolerance regulator N-terminal/von Willebrand factor type A domain